jgi:hypothetical protein
MYLTPHWKLNRHSLQFVDKNMKELLYPVYELKVKTFKKNNDQYRFIAFAAPYEWLSDISHIHHSYFDTLIAELEAVLAGTLEKSGSFGGDHTFCVADKEKTLCEDSQEDTYIYVDTSWMLKVIKEFYEFKKPYFSGYLAQKP